MISGRSKEMELRRGIILILVMAAMTTVTILPCSSQEKKAEEDIWDEPRGPDGGPGREGSGGGLGRGGPGREGPGGGLGRGGPGRGERGPGRYRTSEEEIDHFLNDLKESDPAKAKELESLRKKEPEKFREELRKSVREQWTKRIESWRNRWRTEFLEWLGKAVPKVARDLTKLKDTDPDLYAKQYEIIKEKYRRIFDESRRNPELAEVVMAELELEERQERLLKNIKATKSEKEKKQLMSQLEEVVGNKYDLIIRKKIIAYEFLLKRVEELQEELNRNREEIDKWKDEKIRTQNVKERLDELTEPSRKFNWR
jgi:hemoglobin-like flavoprotein